MKIQLNLNNDCNINLRITFSWDSTVETAICVKKKDKFVSESIVKTGAWEGNNVRNLMKAISFYGDAVFIGEWCFLNFQTLHQIF